MPLREVSGKENASVRYTAKTIWLPIGLGAGIIWGLVALAINAITGIFPFEQGSTHNILTFTFGGVIFGLVSSAILKLTEGYLPSRSIEVKSVIITTSIWLVLSIIGIIISAMPHQAFSPRTIQGLVLAIIMGLILGVSLDIYSKKKRG